MALDANISRPIPLRRPLATLITATMLLVVSAPVVQAAPPGSWEAREPAPFPRHESSYVQVDGLFHLLGGKWRQHNVYDPDSDSWSKAAPLLVKVNRVQAVTLGGKIYVV